MGILAAGIGAALSLAGSDPPRGNSSLAAARTFERYQLYAAGKRVAGLPLTRVNRYYRPKDADEELGFPETDDFSFVYGDCTPPAPTEWFITESPRCQFPLVISVGPACFAPPDFVKHPRSWRTVRGGRAKRWAVVADLQLWTGRVFVRISLTRGSRLPEVVRALAPLNHVDRQPRDRRLLPAPRLDSPAKPYCERPARPR